jgi:DegV family protein with EDD domain
VDLTAANTAIVLDSTADFPEAPQRFPNWRVVPLYVRFGDDSFRDYIDLDPHAFYERLRQADRPPTTSQPTPADFLAAYAELAGYDRVLSIHLSRRLSGTYESADRAANESGERVRTIDSETASAAIAMLALAVQRRLERGTTDEEVNELVARFKSEAALVFTVDTLEYLAKGGRIGKAAAMAGQLLHIKPILTLADGEVLPLKKVRGARKAYREFERAFSEGTTDEPGLRVGIAHAEAPERLDALRRMVQKTRPGATIEVATTLGPVVGTHAGPGTVGLFWFSDPETAPAGGA